jgi:hypothetical protein
LLQDNPSTEELGLPGSVLAQLRKDLENSNQILPETAQEMQGWRVGLLDRFDLEPVKLSSGIEPALKEASEAD